jgi:hypothetical protein
MALIVHPLPDSSTLSFLALCLLPWLPVMSPSSGLVGYLTGTLTNTPGK